MGIGAAPVGAQTPAPAPAASSNEEEKKAPSLWDEFKLFAYVENSYTLNLTGAGRGGVNELRFYDFDKGFTFNMAEFSIKRDPNEAFPFGVGLVITAGRDAQKNHSLGILRDADDAFPFKNTPWFDVQEAYISGRIPVGSGLAVKLGKWVTLLGYEVIESPNNLNFSRGYLFVLGIPLTHTGGLLSYSFTDWLSAQAGVVVGWDNTDDNNDAPSFTGQVAATPLRDFTATFNWIAGPEQTDNDDNVRYVLNLITAYTGIKSLTLALDSLYGHERREAFLASLATRSDTDATWWGVAGYVAYDFTDRFRAALRQEYFADQDGARTGFGSRVDLVSTTATLQYNIWQGLFARLEYRHDHASEKVFKARSPGPTPTSKTLDTISISAFYKFF